MDSIDFSGYIYLSNNDVSNFLVALAEAIYCAYLLDWSRHVIVTGKAFKEMRKTKNLHVEDFPKSNIEFYNWRMKYFHNDISNIKINIGKDLSKSESTKVMREGIKNIGKNNMNLLNMNVLLICLQTFHVNLSTCTLQEI